MDGYTLVISLGNTHAFTPHRLALIKLVYNLPGLGWIVLHADAPYQLLGADSADARRKAFRTPRDWGIATDSAMGCGVFLRHILCVFVSSWCVFEIGPDMVNHPIIARQLPGLRIFNRLPNFAGDLGRRACAFAVVRMFPDGIAGGYHRHFDAVAIMDPKCFADHAACGMREIMPNTGLCRIGSQFPSVRGFLMRHNPAGLSQAFEEVEQAISGAVNASSALDGAGLREDFLFQREIRVQIYLSCLD